MSDAPIIRGPFDFDSMWRGHSCPRNLNRFQSASLETKLASLAGQPRRLSLRESLPNYFNAHGTSGTANAFDCGVNRGSIQIRHLLLGDVLYLLQRHLADLVLIRRA